MFVPMTGLMTSAIHTEAEILARAGECLWEFPRISTGS